MNAKRLYFTLLACIGLLVLALIGGTYETSSLLSQRAVTLTNLKAKSLALEREQQSLTKSKAELKNYTELQKIAQAVVPEDKNQAEAVREIVNIAGANSISLAAISFPASTLGNSATALAGATTTTPTSASPTVPADNPKTDKLSQLLPVRNIPGVYQLTITVQGDSTKPVRYDRFISFLSALEHNRRTAQVSTITVQPSATDRSLLTFSLSLNEYIKP